MPCRAAASDLKVQSPAGNLRYPDALVECGPYQATSYISSEPRVVVEVPSPSNTGRQQLRFDGGLLRDLVDRPPGFLEQDTPAALVWTRTDTGWSTEELTGWEAVVALPAIGAELPLAEIYEGLLPREDAAG